MRETFVVQTTPDGLTTYLEVPGRRTPPFPEVSVEELRSVLGCHGVVAGILPERLEAIRVQLATSGDPIGAVVVARGEPAADGIDGRVEIRVPMGAIAGREVDPTGRVDFRERDSVKNVTAGEVIAEVHPPTEGTAGWTVRGESLAPRPGKPARLPPLGVGVALSEDGRALVAKREGHLSAKAGGRLEVDPVYVVKGDVDFRGGNVHFQGPVEILGSVRQGFTVEASGDLRVRGEVEDGATLVSGGSIRIGLRVRSSGHRTRIEAGGDVHVAEMTGVQVVASGSVHVHGDLFQSRVRSRGRVLVRGSVRGSDLEALGGIEIEGDVGSEGGVKNVLAAGILLEAHVQAREFEGRVRELEKTVDEMARRFQVRYGVDPTAAGAAELSPEDLEARRAWTERQDGIMREIVEKRQALQSLLEQLEYDEKALVAVRGRIHPTCLVHCGEQQFKVNDPLESRIFACDAGGKRVSILPYVSERRRHTLSDLARVEADDPAQIRRRAQAGTITERELSLELDRYLEEDQLAESALQLALAAVKMTKYRTPEIMARIAYAHAALGRLSGDSRESGHHLRRALEQCREILRLSPRNALVHSLLGRIHAATGADEKAIEMHRQAVQLAGQAAREDLVARAHHDQALTLLEILRRSDLDGGGTRVQALLAAARGSLALALQADPEGSLASACRRTMQEVTNLSLSEKGTPT